MGFSATARGLSDFEEEFGFSFHDVPGVVDLDYLQSFMEYVYNFSQPISRMTSPYLQFAKAVTEHIENLATMIDCSFIEDRGYWILVAQEEESWEASEVASSDIGLDLVRYSYRGLKGDLKAKRSILAELILGIEPRRSELGSLSRELESGIFNIANNCNIRHNNYDPRAGKKHNPVLLQMDDQSLEAVYDELHRLCVAACILLDWNERKEEIKGVCTG